MLVGMLLPRPDKYCAGVNMRLAYSSHLFVRLNPGMTWTIFCFERGAYKGWGGSDCGDVR